MKTRKTKRELLEDLSELALGSAQYVDSVNTFRTRLAALTPKFPGGIEKAIGSETVEALVSSERKVLDQLEAL